MIIAVAGIHGGEFHVEGCTCAVRTIVGLHDVPRHRGYDLYPTVTQADIAESLRFALLNPQCFKDVLDFVNYYDEDYGAVRQRPALPGGNKSG